MTIQEFFAFRLQTKQREAQTLLVSKMLFQQFVVDAYTMIEPERLFYVRTHQKERRVEDYRSLNNAKSACQTTSSSVGKRIVFPSSFVGGRRYVDGLYHDCVAICGFVGYPDLFITFTCNSE